ncbi:MAG TPA: DUF885 family protein, partial [Thermoanaerobaculia bacterium]|nr:DUF885 family protein [Thermoanaerobaculia bacterium]
MHRSFRPSLRGLAAAALVLAALPAAAAPAPTPAWVERSDENAQVLLEVLARFGPEGAGQLGIPGLDEQILDLSPGFVERATAATSQAGDELRRRLATEKDPAVRQDLQILISAAEDNIRGNRMEEKYFLPYFNVTQIVFGGLQSLLDDQIEAGRRPAALVRLRKYTGMEPGTKPLTRLAEDFTRAKLADAKLLGPFKDQIERDLATNQTVITGIGELFAKYGIKGYEEPYAKLKEQLAAYDAFVKKEILPRARTDFRLPPEVYAESLKQVGIDMPIDDLVSRAEVAFKEIQNEMAALAPLVAKEKGIASTDYREVLRELKKRQIVGEGILAHYEERIRGLEEIIRKEKIVTLPDRAMKFRVASEAESVGSPAPHMQPPRLIGNTGEMGEFVLPLRIPGQQGQKNLALDDFTYDAFSWALTAHEGRPGHELQFAALVEKGVSKARAIFAFNSVNVEGWALYSEAEVKPYLP